MCVEELRSRRIGGTWRCVWYQSVADEEVPMQVRDPGGPCTLRRVDQETGLWTCRSDDSNETGPLPGSAYP